MKETSNGEDGPPPLVILYRDVIRSLLVSPVVMFVAQHCPWGFDSK